MIKSKLTPRNPYVALAKFRNAGLHTKPKKSLRRQDKQFLAKTVKQSSESWQKCISAESAFAMTPDSEILDALAQICRGRLVRHCEWGEVAFLRKNCLIRECGLSLNNT